MRNKDWRIHHSKRIKNKIKSWHTSKYYDEINIKKRYHTKCVCSCFMCGNPRKYFGEETIQEKRSKNKFDDYLNGNC